MHIILDGIDGAGKTTLIEHFLEEASERDASCFGDAREYHHLAFPQRLPSLEEKATPLGRTLFYLRDFERALRGPCEAGAYYVYDRSFVSTLAYQGFLEGLKVDAGAFDAIAALGSRAFFDRPLDRPAHGQRHTAFFVHVTCDARDASRRVGHRGLGAQGDDVDALEGGQRVDALAALDQRYAAIYPYLRIFLSRFPHWDFHFLQVSTQRDGAREAAKGLCDALKPWLWPDQMALPLPAG